MNIFRISGAPVLSAMISEMARMLQQCQQVVPLIKEVKVPCYPQKTAEALRLEKMGFTNAALVAEFKRQMVRYEQSRQQYENRVKNMPDVERILLNGIQIVNTLAEARQTFGDDTLLVPYSAFERLMRKYNLVCGPFGSYKGEIPGDKVEEIERLQNLMFRTKHDYINQLVPLTGLKYDNNEYLYRKIPGYIKRFPFAKKKWAHSSWSSWNVVDMHGNDIRDSWKWEYEIGRSTELFICAPSKHMEKIRALRVPRIIGYNDPFICAHTDYGILVFTRWGEEAGDRIIRKYERVNRLLKSLNK